jgi:hypothetical protein
MAFPGPPGHRSVYQRAVSQQHHSSLLSAEPGRLPELGRSEVIRQVHSAAELQLRLNHGRLPVALPLANETNGYDIRIDQYIGSKNLLFGRWSWKNLPQQAETAGSAAPQTAQLLPPTTNDEYDKNLIISDNYTITPHIVNEFRFGLSRLELNSTFPYQGAAGGQPTLV